MVYVPKSSLAPRVSRQLTPFPRDTTLVATKDGKDIVVYMNSSFLKRIVDGTAHYPVQRYNILLSRDFRRASLFFAWLGPGQHRVRIQNLDPVAVETVVAVGSEYGRWLEPGLLEVQN